MANTFHPIEEFGDFPWDKLAPASRVEYARGNHHSIVVDGDPWEIPDELLLLLAYHIDRGKDAAMVAVREAIGAKKEDFVDSEV